MRNVAGKIVGEIETHILCAITFSPKFVVLMR